MKLNVTIDGRAIGIEPGTTVLNAATTAGVYIPHLCYQRKLSIKGGCRVCLVEVEGTPKLQPACSTVVCEGMKVKTDTQQVKDARRAVLELLLINHPLECPICDAGGECKLQDYVFWYGSGLGRFRFDKRTFPREDIGPFVVRDMNRCIHCTRCVRFAFEVSRSEDIGVFERGEMSSIGPYLGRELRNPFSGNITELCPVGALTDRVFRFKARSWELQDVPSSCPLCSAGCLNFLQLKRGRILRVQTREKSRVPWICDLGRFGFAAQAEEQSRPLVVEDGRQIAVPWDVAAQTVAGRLRMISKESGPESVAAVCGTLATNEEIFALQHVFRNVLKCRNIGFGPGAPQAGAQEEVQLFRDALLAQGRIDDLAGCDSVLFLCADPYEEVPVAGLEILQVLGLAAGGGGVRVGEGGEAGTAAGASIEASGASDNSPAAAGASGGNAASDALSGPAVKIIAMGPRRPSPSSVQMTWIAATPRDSAGTVAYLALELVKLAAGAGRTEKPKEGGLVSGKELGSEHGFWVSSRKLGIVVGSQLFASPLSCCVLASVLRICTARSRLGAETVPLFLLGDANARGALEFGVLAAHSLARDTVTAGGTSHDGPAGLGAVGGNRARDLSAGPPECASFSEIVESARAGKLRALFVFGADLLAQCHERSEVEGALKNVEFLFAQSETVNETSRMAHVYLPLQGIFDKEGSFTDLEGRLLGLSPQSSAAGASSLLFPLLSSICQAVGGVNELDGPETVFSHMKKSYDWTFKETIKALSRTEGVFPAGLGNAGSREEGSWRRPLGTWLALREFERRTYSERAAREPAPGPAQDVSPDRTSGGEFVLLCGTAGVSSWVWAQHVTLHPKIPTAVFVEISRADAERLAIREGDTVEVSSARGRVKAKAALSESLMPGAVFVPLGFPGEVPNVLLSSRDEVTRVDLRKIQGEVSAASGTRHEDGAKRDPASGMPRE
jgi:NADH dehydrogenase/NADH:ubiquinone oxidoreductase subunit G/formylmethanofuran dehydrogenase subunit D